MTRRSKLASLAKRALPQPQYYLNTEVVPGMKGLKLTMNSNTLKEFLLPRSKLKSELQMVLDTIDSKLDSMRQDLDEMKKLMVEKGKA